MQERITQTFISNLKKPDKAYWVSDSIVPNLSLFVGKSGATTWYVFYRTEDSRKKKVHKLGPAGGAITVSMAREMARDFMARLARGENPTKKKIDRLTLGEFLEKYYEPWAKAERKSGAFTVSTMRSAFVSFLGVEIVNLHVRDMEKWRHGRMASGTKAATCNRRLTALKAALNWGVKRDILQANPLERLEKLKEHDSEIKVRFLSPEERIRLFKALDDREKRIRVDRGSHNKWLKERNKPPFPDIGYFADHLKPMVIIALNTGMRQGNLFSLLWGDINLDQETILLRASETKSGKGSYLPMNDAVRNTLENWLKQSSKIAPNNLVFPSPKTGEGFTNVKKAWAGVLKDAEIENFRWHDMRHDFASQLVMKGVDLNTVRELLGHSDLKMTLRYAHLAPTIKRSAVDLL